MTVYFMNRHHTKKYMFAASLEKFNYLKNSIILFKISLFNYLLCEYTNLKWSHVED